MYYVFFSFLRTTLKLYSCFYSYCITIVDFYEMSNSNKLYLEFFLCSPWFVESDYIAIFLLLDRISLFYTYLRRTVFDLSQQLMHCTESKITLEFFLYGSWTYLEFNTLEQHLALEKSFFYTSLNLQ